MIGLPGPRHCTFVAYQSEDSVYCPECWTCETGDEEIEAGMTQARLYERFPDGCRCDQCGVVLVAIIGRRA